MMMRVLGLGIALACLAAPAFAEPGVCASEGYQVAKKPFVESINNSNAALSSRNFASALTLAAAGRPHAQTPRQAIAITQLEIAAYYGLEDRAAASTLMKSAMSDACLPEGVRANYAAMLAKWGMKAN